MENGKKQSGRIYALILFLGLGLAGLYYLFDHFVYPGRFSPGVEIGGIAVEGYDRREAASMLANNLEVLYDNRITFYKDDYIREVRLGELCVPLDPAAIVESVWQQEKSRGWRAKLDNLDGEDPVVYPVAITYDSAQQALLVQEWEAKWAQPPQDASIEINSLGRLTVIPDHTGVKVDAEATFKILPKQVDQKTTLRGRIFLTGREADITAEMLENMGLLASYSTYFNSGDVNRSHNLTLAASHIDKSMIAAHTVFSVNDTVGERTEENGFRDAKIIVGDKFEDGLGGGVCQVSSTLYNACLLAGLEIVERNNHNLAVAYVPLGQDAAVAYGLQDFQFKNSTDKPLYVRAITSRGQLTMSVYGNLNYKKNIAVSHIIDQTIEYTAAYETDRSLPPGTQRADHKGQPGYVVRSFRTFYDDQGNITYTEQLAQDTYRPLNTLIIMGPPLAPIPAVESA